MKHQTVANYTPAAGTVLCLLLAIGCIAGCMTALEPNSSPESVPVTQGAATTNDSPIVAWLKVADAVNHTANITASQEPISIILGAAITGFSALGGWLARHQTAKQHPDQPSGIPSAQVKS